MARPRGAKLRITRRRCAVRILSACALLGATQVLRVPTAEAVFGSSAVNCYKDVRTWSNVWNSGPHQASLIGSDSIPANSCYKIVWRQRVQFLGAVYEFDGALGGNPSGANIPAGSGSLTLAPVYGNALSASVCWTTAMSQSVPWFFTVYCPQSRNRGMSVLIHRTRSRTVAVSRRGRSR